MGGYSGVEGEADTKALDTAEVLSLSAQAQYQSEAQWCHAPLPPAPLRLEGATMDWVSVTEHMAAMLTADPLYTSPHSLVIWDKVLICGGADKEYVVSPWCWWWGVEDNSWAQGPKMLFARQRAASLQRNGMIWMLGGREGSTILKDNEVLMYPGTYNGTNHKMWMWMHKVDNNVVKGGDFDLHKNNSGHAETNFMDFERPQQFEAAPYSLDWTLRPHD